MTDHSKALTNLPTTDELRALLQCGIDDANDAGKVMHVEPSWMRYTCQLALDEIERLRKALHEIITAHCASDGNWKYASRLQAEMADAALGHPFGKPTDGFSDSPVEPETPK